MACLLLLGKLFLQAEIGFQRLSGFVIILLSELQLLIDWQQKGLKSFIMGNVSYLLSADRAVVTCDQACTGFPGPVLGSFFLLSV